MPDETPAVTASTTLLEAVQLNSACEEVLRAHDAQAGCCLLCSHLFDSIGHVAERYGLDLQQLLDECNRSQECGAPKTSPRG